MFRVVEAGGNGDDHVVVAMLLTAGSQAGVEVGDVARGAGFEIGGFAGGCGEGEGEGEEESGNDLEHFGGG